MGELADVFVPAGSAATTPSCSLAEKRPGGHHSGAQPDRYLRRAAPQTLAELNAAW